MKRSLLVIAASAALFACGGGADARPEAQAAPPPLELERLPPGPLPGTRIRGHFRVPGVGAVRYVRRLAVSGGGVRRTVLLIARGSRREPCFTAVVGALIQRATFTCLKRWDRPPMLVRVAVGGESRKTTDWLALVGLVRREVKGVAVDSQGGGIISSPRLREWQGFPWKAFATPPAFRHRFPNRVRARVASRTVQEIDIGWSYGAACDEQGSPRCTPRRLRAGRWSAVRDPDGSGTAPSIRRGGGARAKRVAIDHPVVRRLVAGQPFSIGRVAQWSKCSGDLIGAIVPIRLVEPIDFEGDVPFRQYEASSHAAYLEGVAHLRVQRAVSFDIDVDLNRKRVVGIGPGLYLPDADSGVPKPIVDMKVIGELRPGGGPDSGNCAQKGE